MPKIGLVLVALSCVQLAMCLEWQNSILKLENGVITRTELEAPQTAATTKANDKVTTLETDQRSFFRLPLNLVHNDHPVYHHQEPVVPVVNVEPVYNHVHRPPVSAEKPSVSEAVHLHDYHDHEHHDHFDYFQHHQHAQPVEPFPIAVPVVDTLGDVIVENTVGGIPFDCRFKPSGHWRDPNFCDVFHACVHGYHRKTYACPIVGERTYFDEHTRRCEFVHRNPQACLANFHDHHHHQIEPTYGKKN